MNISREQITLLLQKVASFANVAVEEVRGLEHKLHEQRKQAAVEEFKQIKLAKALEKAAESLYRADFITDEYERREFLKKAKDDPSYLARMLEKVCDAADVAPIGSPARVTKPKLAEYDPVAARAFGYNKSSFVIED